MSGQGELVPEFQDAPEEVAGSAGQSARRTDKRPSHGKAKEEPDSERDEVKGKAVGHTFDVSSLIAIDLDKDLDKALFNKPHVKLGVLKALNYHTWAQSHKRFLKGRGLYGIVTGEMPMPVNRFDRAPARRWVMLDQWTATLLAGNVEETQQSHIADLTTAKEIWDTLRRVHGVSGKGRLSTILQKFYGYVKSTDQTVDQMALDLHKLRDEIADVEPTAAPSSITTAVVIMNACQGSEYSIAKYTLSMSSDLTMELAVEHLRSVEQDK